MKRRISLSLLIGLVSLIIIFYPRLNIITGFAAKNICSATFIANRELNSIETTDNDFSPIKYTTNIIDFEKKSVSSWLFGLEKRTAVFQEGLGCVLIPSGTKVIRNYAPKRNFDNLKNLNAYPYGNGPVNETKFDNIDYDALNIAVNNAFDDDILKRTRAVVVVYKDSIIAESYKSGINKDTKLLGWSMTKSITSAILGVLEKKKKISISQTNLFPEWENDEKSNITLGNLIQMNCGISWEEDYTSISDVTKMLYMERDMTSSALYKPINGTPGETWKYNSGISNLLSRFIRNQFDSHSEYLDFWYENLIDEIGMNSMIIETDSKGNYIGSSYSWATARDWAKFGLLYLHKGNWNGKQIINEEWVKYTSTPAKGSDGIYGAHFWLNAGGKYPNVPRDLYSANGFQGQHVYIIPSEDLVIVRFGTQEKPRFGNEFADEFLSDILIVLN